MNQNDMRELYVLPAGHCSWCLNGEGVECQEQENMFGHWFLNVCPRPFPWEEDYKPK